MYSIHLFSLNYFRILNQYSRTELSVYIIKKIGVTRNCIVVEKSMMN